MTDIQSNTKYEMGWCKMQRINVDTRELSKDLSEMDVAIRRIKNKQRQNQNYLEEMKRVWTGEAYSVFQASFQKTDKNMTKVTTALTKNVKGMQEICRDYEKCEADVERLIATISF